MPIGLRMGDICMYTLEDDKETSVRMRKRDFQASPYATNPDAQTEAADDPSGSEPTVSTNSQHSQITRKLPELATPLTDARTRASKRLVGATLFVACASVFITSMDETVVVTALPKIIADPGINISITQLDHAAWIISAYLLGFVIAMPLMGRVSDIFGRRRVMLICLSIFGVGSVFCGLAPMLGQSLDISFLNSFGIDTSSQGLTWLISARFVQAIGGGAIVPVAMAIVSDTYGRKRLGVALGIIGAVTEAGGVVGPLYGALIVQTLGWTYIFFLNVPIVIALMVGVSLFTPKNKRLHEGIDWLGAILLGLALTCLSLGLAQQGTELGPALSNGSAPQNNPVSLALAVIFLVLFILLGRLKIWRSPRISLFKRPRLTLARKTHWPVIDLALFTRLPFVAASLVSLLIGAALIIAMADIPLFVDTVYSQQVPSSDTALVSGLALLRMTAMIPVGALLGGWLCGRLSCRLTGIVGLLFAATGFYLMSRWSVTVDWTQITISTLTTGLGFGLVIAPISTTAINAVKTNQAGMGSAIVTALRMVGMILGLAGLTSWGLAYFKQLAAQFPSLPTSATAAQFGKWAQDYAVHLIKSAHTVYSSIFFVTMIICLLAMVPALFLWGTKPAEEAESLQVAEEEADANAVTMAEETTLVGAAVPPLDPDDKTQVLRRGKRKRRRLLIVAIIALIALLIGGSLLAMWFWPTSAPSASAAPGTQAISNPTATPSPISGPRMIALGLNSTALTSIFVSQLGVSGGTLTNIQTYPTAGDGLVLTLDLNINTGGIHRVMPIEIDSALGMDGQQNLQLRVLRVRRDGLDAGATAAINMQSALNQLLLTTVMPALHSQLKGARLVSVSTSSTIACGKGEQMLVLLISAPPIQGIAAQPKPVPLCFTKPVNLNNLLPG